MKTKAPSYGETLQIDSIDAWPGTGLSKRREYNFCVANQNNSKTVLSELDRQRLVKMLGRCHKLLRSNPDFRLILILYV